MKKFSPTKITALATEIGLATMTMTQIAHAAGITDLNNGVTDASPTGANPNLFTGNGSLFHVISDTLIFIVGAVSVIMLIIGGLRYVLSSGNSSSVEGAKNTILFAIIGLIVAILAFAIVTFVVQKFNT